MGVIVTAREFYNQLLGPGRRTTFCLALDLILRGQVGAVALAAAPDRIRADRGVDALGVNLMNTRFPSSWRDVAGPDRLQALASMRSRRPVQCLNHLVSGNVWAVGQGRQLLVGWAFRPVQKARQTPDPVWWRQRRMLSMPRLRRPQSSQQEQDGSDEQPGRGDIHTASILPSTLRSICLVERWTSWGLRRGVESFSS